MVIDSDILFLMIPDALIAAAALIEGDSLVTRNRRHFIFIEDLILSDY
jgi:predicted nucleic acid-binding protein